MGVRNIALRVVVVGTAILVCFVQFEGHTNSHGRRCCSEALNQPGWPVVELTCRQVHFFPSPNPSDEVHHSGAMHTACNDDSTTNRNNNGLLLLPAAIFA